MTDATPTQTSEASPERPRARLSDPETSHEAAASVGDLRLSQAGVLRAFQSHHDLTDEELAHVYEMKAHPMSTLYPPQSPSGLRTRRHELVDRGLVRYAGTRRIMSTGRMARVWELVT